MRCEEWIERLKYHKETLENGSDPSDGFLFDLRALKNKMAECSERERGEILSLLQQLEAIALHKRNEVFKKIEELDTCKFSLDIYRKY